MATFKDLKECFEITGFNPLAILDEGFNIDKLEHTNPLVYQYFVWKYRKKTNPELKLDDVQNIDFQEIREAIRNFFLGDIQTKT